jgi:ABC-type Fe3+-siderophore transport system permease subunit
MIVIRFNDADSSVEDYYITSSIKIYSWNHYWCLALLSIILVLLLILVRKFGINSCDNAETLNDVGSVT